MNFIAQLKGFRRQRLSNTIGANSICLYLILFEYANEINFPDWFTAPNSTLQGLTGLSISSLRRSRNELVQKGFISYKLGNGNACGRYHLQDLSACSEQQTDNKVNNKRITNEQQMANKVNTLYNLTKTNLNERNYDEQVRGASPQCARDVAPQVNLFAENDKAAPPTAARHGEIHGGAGQSATKSAPKPADRAPPKPPKLAYGEYKHVLLSEDELAKLNADYPNVPELIKHLDEYIEMKGYKAQNHYLVINKWVVKAVDERRMRDMQTYPAHPPPQQRGAYGYAKPDQIDMAQSLYSKYEIEEAFNEQTGGS